MHSIHAMEGNAFQIFEATDEMIWKLPGWSCVEERLLRKTKKSEEEKEEEYSGHAEGESDLKRRGEERVAEISREPTIASAIVFRSICSKRSTNVTQGTNMEITSLACFQTPAFQRYF